MDNVTYKEAAANADIAFSNENYEGAVKWFDKALASAPKDVYALSRAGAALVALGRFKEAYPYFQRAIDAEPQNGDNLFNMANAYFFEGNVSKAIEYYTLASVKPCSKDVKARIFYQLALMCTIKQDYKAALINYQKFEDMDETGKASLDVDIITEKLQLYVRLEDYENAKKCAVKWVGLAPSELRAYMAYFNLLLANNEFAEAEKALDDAVKYAVTDEAGKFAVDISRANLCSLAAGSEIDSAGDFDQKAYDLLSELIVSPLGTPQQKNELVLSLAELCIKMGRTDEAIDLLTVLAEKPGAAKEEAPETDGTALPAAPDPAEIDALRERDMQRMDALVAEGMVDESIGELAEVTYDENGSPVRNYPEGTFDDIPEGADPVKFGLPTPEKLVELEKQAEAENTAELNARVNFMLLSCYSTKNDFEKVLEYAAAVKAGAKESYYSFFGHYAEAFAALQLAKEGKRFTLEEAQDKYDRELAFFRNETMKRTPSSNYALLFRARMYAELGKYDKAAELSELLDPDDKAAVEQYIEDCRRDAEKN
ncbi:MAG: tetratricopeptide repeat protein [Ruminococcus sp.]|nr:tetratricopeptide repeat protein [Ruminococcus sp.]